MQLPSLQQQQRLFSESDKELIEFLMCEHVAMNPQHFTQEQQTYLFELLRIEQPKHLAIMIQHVNIQQIPLRCPRCFSWNTRFDYFNNNRNTQPRIKCKGCQRQWTVGGKIKDVPEGSKNLKKKKPVGVSNGSNQSSAKKPRHENLSATNQLGVPEGKIKVPIKAKPRTKARAHSKYTNGAGGLSSNCLVSGGSYGGSNGSSEDNSMSSSKEGSINEQDLANSYLDGGIVIDDHLMFLEENKELFAAIAGLEPTLHSLDEIPDLDLWGEV